MAELFGKQASSGRVSRRALRVRLGEGGAGCIRQCTAHAANAKATNIASDSASEESPLATFQVVSTST